MGTLGQIPRQACSCGPAFSTCERGSVLTKREEDCYGCWIRGVADSICRLVLWWMFCLAQVRLLVGAVPIALLKLIILSSFESKTRLRLECTTGTAGLLG